MQILTEKLRVPEFRVTEWVQDGPLSMHDLRGKVVLVDFWDYTCVNCLHTLPYLREWHRRYTGAGLVIVGVHAPEFEFARERAHIANAVRELDLPYPIALDNDFRTWDAYANRAWPAKYLVDAHGYIRAFHHGEGEYGAFERLIQTLLREAGGAFDFPEPMVPVREMDRPGAACLRPTPELYLGTARGTLGNREDNPPDSAVRYTLPAGERRRDTVYLEGPWRSLREAVEAGETENSRLHLDYEAVGVNLVLAPPLPGSNKAHLPGDPVFMSEGLEAVFKVQTDERSGGMALIRLELDGVPLPPAFYGEDVAHTDGAAVIRFESPRMVRLIAHPDLQRHRLTVTALTPGLRAYAFTFTGCVAEPGAPMPEQPETEDF